MQFIMMRCVMFMTLLAGFNNLCMESNEENNKEHGPLDNELKQMRQEHAKRYQREKEKKQKKAEHLHAKNKKLNKQQEQPEAKPEKNSDGKQEELESQVPSEPLLTQEGQTELFAQAKQAIALARAKKPDPQQEEESEPTFKKIFNFVDKHKDKLSEENFDPLLVEQVIAWISNSKMSISPVDFYALVTILTNYCLNSRIMYTLFRNPFIHALSNAPAESAFYDIVMHHLDNRFSERAGKISSAQILFIPFALTLSRERVFYRFVNNYLAIQSQTWRNRHPGPYLDNFDRNTLEMERNQLNIARNEHENGDIEYLSITKNVDFIRCILFETNPIIYTNLYLIQQVIKEKSSEFIGDERTPDGTTALMFAVGGGYVGIVKELLRRGANPFLMNNHGDDAFSIVEIQLKRATLHNNSELIKIYTRIQQLLEASARKYVLHIAQLIRALQSERTVTSDNTETVVPGLPYELVLPIALANFNAHSQRIMLRLLNQVPTERLLPTKPNQQPTHAEQPVVQELLSHSSAWIATLLLYTYYALFWQKS